MIDEEGAEEVAHAERKPLLSLKALGHSFSSTSLDPELVQNGGEFDTKFAIGQVTVRLPFDWRPLPVLALFVSFVAFPLPLLLAADAIYHHRWSSAFLVLLISICSMVNEFVLKPVFKQPRPSCTANRDTNGEVLPGMLSGHVLICQILATWYALEVILSFSNLHAVWILAPLVLLMALVPWARWYNGDHTCEQVLVTAVVATGLGAAAFATYHVFLQENHQAAALSELDLSGGDRGHFLSEN